MGEDFFKFLFYFFTRSVDWYARMIYGGCFYHTVSGFVIIKAGGAMYGDVDDEKARACARVEGEVGTIDMIGIKLE